MDCLFVEFVEFSVKDKNAEKSLKKIVKTTDIKIVYQLDDDLFCIEMEDLKYYLVNKEQFEKVEAILLHPLVVVNNTYISPSNISLEDFETMKKMI